MHRSHNRHVIKYFKFLVFMVAFALGYLKGTIMSMIEKPNSEKKFWLVEV